MSYRLNLPEDSVLGEGQFVDAHGNTECVVFVQQAAGAPRTAQWEAGVRVADVAPEVIIRGTAIATFDAGGHYPADGLGKHAAIYLWHTAEGIEVLDQWNAQGAVRRRVIRFACPPGTSRSNDGKTFHVIE